MDAVTAAYVAIGGVVSTASAVAAIRWVLRDPELSGESNASLTWPIMFILISAVAGVMFWPLAIVAAAVWFALRTFRAEPPRKG